MPPGRSPVRLVVRVDEEKTPGFVPDDDIGRNAFARLACVALGEVGKPGLGVGLVQSVSHLSGPGYESS
jgi:hypothetical protein